MSSFHGRLMHWRRLATANPWPFCASFLAGVLIAFVYSYVPLHTVNNRKVDRLEASVSQKEARIDDLARQVADLRGGSEEAPDASELAALTTERDEAVRARELADKEVHTAKLRVRSLESERAQWKQKIARLEKQAAESLASAAAVPAAVVPSSEARSRAVAGAAPPEVIVPAAPAP